MNVLLINPTYHTFFSLGLSFGEPLGLAYIAAVIERSTKHHVEIIDSVGLSHAFDKENDTLRIGLPVEELLAMVKERDPDIVGVSLITSLYAQEIISFLKEIKRIKPDVLLMVGGAHATLEWKRCIKEPSIDIIVMGEGERTVVELLESIEIQSPLESIRGIVFKNKDEVPVKTAEREPVNIESLPFPARHLLPMHNYFKHRPRYYYMRHPVASIMTSRACPFNCIFCSTTLLWGRKFRGNSPKNVVDEMAHLHNEYGVREFLINDDSFTADRSRVIGICDEIINRGLDIRYQIPPGVNLHLLDEELLIKFKRSGLYVINPQFETGNPKTVKYIRKPINLAKGVEIIDKANQLGFWTKTNILLGFPKETKEDIETTIQFIEKLNVDAVNIVLPIAYSHTDLGKDYIKHGLMAPDQTAARTCDSLHFTKEQLEEIRLSAVRRFNKARIRRFLSPKYVLVGFFPKINDVEKLWLFVRRMWFGVFQRFYKNI